MTVSIFDSCTERCGWFAAVVAVFAWGSFGVPIKVSVPGIDVHPLVMQTYKTLVCFCTCWFVLLLGVEVQWTKWGLLSGLFWVPGAMGGIYGIRNAGLAIAVGTWSSIGVLTSFFFGIVIFEEQVKHFGLACLAFLCLIVGLIGMSRFSSSSTTITTEILSNGNDFRAGATGSMTTPVSANIMSTHVTGKMYSSINKKKSSILPLEMEMLLPTNDDDEFTIMGSSTAAHVDTNEIRNDISESDTDDDSTDPRRMKDRLVFVHGNLSLTRRQAGLLGAMLNGAWGSLNLVPLHYARKKDNLSGAAYLISYATGSMIVQSCIWIVWFLFYWYKQKNVRTALSSLPCMHWNDLWYPGLLAGLLYSTGNFASILAVTYLGQGTGYSFTQMQLFVSGLWGVFYFKEIRGTGTVLKWFCSALIAICGIIWLSYEHEGTTGHRRLAYDVILAQ